MDVGNGGVARSNHQPPFLTYMDVGNAGVAGAFTGHHPWWSQRGGVSLGLVIPLENGIHQSFVPKSIFCY
jgi:hypothetical protein